MMLFRRRSLYRRSFLSQRHRQYLSQNPFLYQHRLEVTKDPSYFGSEHTTSQPIIGWRAWRVSTFTHYLIPVAMRTTVGWPDEYLPWYPCVRSEAYHHNAGHSAPRLDCSCGFWALKTLADLSRAIGIDSEYVVGRVSFWGKVHEGTIGYRGQYAYPYELWVHTSKRQLIPELRDAYKVDVFERGNDFLKIMLREEASVKEPRSI